MIVGERIGQPVDGDGIVRVHCGRTGIRQRVEILGINQVRLRIRNVGVILRGVDVRDADNGGSSGHRIAIGIYSLNQQSVVVAKEVYLDAPAFQRRPGDKKLLPIHRDGLHLQGSGAGERVTEFTPVTMLVEPATAKGTFAMPALAIALRSELRIVPIQAFRPEVPGSTTLLG